MRKGKCNMLSLVYKDFYQTRKVLIFCLVIWAVFLGIGMINGAEGGASLVYSFGIIMVNTVLTRILYNEDRYQGTYFMKTLPIKSSLIVTSKFVGGFILVAGSSLMTCLAASIICRMGLHGLTSKDVATATLMSFAFTLVFCGVFLRLYFAYGYAKVAQYMVLATIGIVIIVSVIIAILKELATAMTLTAIMSQPYWIAIFPIIAIIVYIECWRSALRRFK